MMTINRIAVALVLCLLLPLAGEGMADSKTLQQKTVSQIVFFVH